MSSDSKYLSLDSEILNEAIQIGDDLLSRAKQNEIGTYWESMTLDANRKITWETTENLYSGVSGIILFLSELYKKTKDEKYLIAVKSGMNWLEDYYSRYPANYYSFLTGGMGAAFIQLQMYKMTANERYLLQALQTAKQGQVFLEGHFAIDDFIGGRGGALLGLLHLHAVSKESWILQTLDCMVENLIQSAHADQNGLYWDRSGYAIRGLCGFSHGASGLGLVFLELGHYFGNETFYWIAEQAFAYEDQWFDNSKNNWPDFRRDRDEFQKQYENGNFDFFITYSDMNAWCHGAAGIGMARLRAYQLLQKEQYWRDTQNAARKVIETDVNTDNLDRTFTLCHGVGGNSNLLLSVQEFCKDNRYEDEIQTVCEKMFASKKKHDRYLSGFGQSKDSDVSLFMGDAGIGYFLLRVLDPAGIENILCPIINEKNTSDISQYSNISISLEEIQRRIIRKIYPKSLYFSEQFLPQTTKEFLNMAQADPVNNFTVLVNSYIEAGKTENDAFKEFYDFENVKIQMNRNIKSNSLLYTKAVIQSMKTASINSIINDLTENTNLVLDEEYKLYDLNAVNEDEAGYILLHATEMGISESRISALAFAVLCVFTECKKISAGLAEIAGMFEDGEDFATLKNLAMQQIKEAVASSILIPIQDK